MADRIGKSELEIIETESVSLWRKSFQRLLRNRTAVIGAILLIFILLISIFAPLVATHSPTDQSLRDQLKPPSSEHYFGTDDLGRDVFSRVVHGSRISLLVGIGVMILRGVVGITVGMIAGFMGGRIDTILMRIADAVISFPGILLALAIMAIWGAGLVNVIIALSVVGWPQFARLVRAEVLSLREREYVEAARGLGLSDVGIMARHIFPNILPLIIVYASLTISAPIVSEAALSFLGLGIQPPDVSWGRMLSGAQRYMRVAWWMATIPGLAITITVLSFNLLGDGLRDALDPRMN